MFNSERAMSVVCVKCVSGKASLECSQCGQAFGVGGFAPLCEACSSDIHQTMSARHNIKTIGRIDDSSAKPDMVENGGSEWLSSVRSCEEMIHQVQANRQLLKEQVEKALDDFKQLLDTRQAALFSNFDTVCERKVKMLSRHLEQLQATVTSGGCGPTPPPPPPAPFPALPGNTSCGFVPPMATLQHATVCLMADCSDEVREGDRVSVTAIGSIDQSGCFSVRILPDRDGLQDIMLQNISNSLEIDHALSHYQPLNLQSGLLCSARYTVDQRWYRAKVVDHSSNRGKVKVYFVDHGNIEDVPTSSVGPLLDKYQVFPFQMLQCCLSTDTKFNFGKREVRWKFNDLTHGRSLTAVIVDQLPENVRGKLYLVQLWDETSPQRLDVGASVLAVAEAMAGGHQKDSIRYRDVRYKDQPLPPNSKQVVTSSSSSLNTSSTTPSGSLSSQDSKPLSTQHTAPSQSSQSALSSQSTPSSQPDLSSQQTIPTTTTTTVLKSETPDALEQADQKYEQQAPNLPATAKPEPKLPQPHGTSEKQSSQLSTIVQSELDKPSSKSVQAEDKSLSNTLSTAANAGKPQTTPPAHTCDQTSTASSDSSIPQSVTSIHTSDTLVSKAPLLSSPESSSLVQTSQTSSDVTKSRQPEVSQPSISELQSTIDAKDSYSGSSNPPPSNKEGIAVEKAPPPGAEVGVAKAEPAQNSQDSLTRVKTEESNSTIGERGTEKGGGSSAAEEELLRLMHPSIVPGAELEAYVTTSLSPDGIFWAQLSLDDPGFDAMAEELRLKLSESRDIMTPVFFNAGDLCAGIFSEDDSWYRARIISAREGMFTVRYLDFGNSEEREARHLALLRSEFKQLPFQALQCSIVCEDHTSFTQPEVDKFNKVVPTEEPVTIKILKVEGTVAFVEVLLTLAGGESVDLTEEVYSADVSVIKSMDFGSSQMMGFPSGEPLPSFAALPLPLSTAGDGKHTEKVSTDALPSPLTLPSSNSLAHQSNWADEMDAIQSPQDDGFLTLPGQDSKGHGAGGDRSKSPSPSPSFSLFSSETQTAKHNQHERQQLQQQQREVGSVESVRSVESLPARGRLQQQREAGSVESVHSAESLAPRDRRKERETSRSISPRPAPTTVRHSHDDRDGRRAASPATRSVGSGVGPSRSAPRLNIGMATKQILSGIGHGIPNRGSREGRRRERGDGPPQSSTMAAAAGGEKVMGNQHPLEQNHVTSSAIGERSPSPHRFPVPTASQGSQSPDKHSTPPSRRRSPDPDIIQLFVKNIPSSMSPTDVSKIFATYGKVHRFVQDPMRKQVVYVLMNSENAQKAINGLHGKAIAKNCHPLVVEQSKEKRI